MQRVSKQLQFQKWEWYYGDFARTMGMKRYCKQGGYNDAPKSNLGSIVVYYGDIDLEYSARKECLMA